MRFLDEAVMGGLGYSFQMLWVFDANLHVFGHVW